MLSTAVTGRLAMRCSRSFALIQLHPLEWSEAVTATGQGSPYVGSVLDQAFSMAQAVVVPGHDAGRRGTTAGSRSGKAKKRRYEVELTPQARPNVLFRGGHGYGTFTRPKLSLSSSGRCDHSVTWADGTCCALTAPQSAGRNLFSGFELPALT